MGKTEELELFTKTCDDFLDSKYILADVKIVGVLKSIAGSETLLALFKNCLSGFDYEKAKKKYLVKSKYLSGDKGEYVLPRSSRELLAFTFMFLLDVDAKRIDLGEFVKRYFYEDGSFTLGYSAFLNTMIKPFRDTVKAITERIIEGRIQDPVEAFTEEEERKEREAEEEKKRKNAEKELLSKTYGESLKSLREILLIDRQKIEAAKISDGEKRDLSLIVTMLGNVLESGDKESINYAYAAYKFAVRTKRFMFFGRVKKTQKLIEDVLNGI